LKKLVSFLAALLVVVCFAGSSQAFGPVDLRITTNYGPAHRALPIVRHWAQRVYEETGGRVRSEIFPGESLLRQTEMYPALLEGIVDVIAQDPSHNPEMFPLMAGFTLPGIQMDNSIVATHVANAYYRSDFDELRRAKFLFAIGLAPSGLQSNVRIDTLEDFSGLQIRANPFAAPPIRALGAAPVGLTASEIYEALLRGTIDASCIPFDALVNWNLAEVSRYAIIVPVISNTTHYVAMNLERWNSFPDDIKAAIERVNLECIAMAAPLWDTMGAEGTQFALERNVEVYALADSEIARIVRVLEPLQANWVAEMNALRQPGQEALDRLKELAAHYNALYGGN
jgi:TRAP-type C4-dicarboxylate transport system substrate-binding protein